MLKFYIDNENNRDHLMWLSLSGKECKLAESFGDSMEFEFEDIEFLRNSRNNRNNTRSFRFGY